MIRIRDTNGKPAEIHDTFRFVEICDKAGQIAVVVYCDNAGAVKMIETKDKKEVERYEHLFRQQGVKFCPLLTVEGPQA